MQTKNYQYGGGFGEIENQKALEDHRVRKNHRIL